ncbi:MAG: Peptidase S24 and S26 domain protein [Candidatus Falkowbacteria bacterium GW2011_GWF2_43_32]|nr:MAG: Peptidase S24 and S26 domain protein [Candidatus Falkowbacteria bacterium GW2011_GWF2_43_32]
MLLLEHMNILQTQLLNLIASTPEIGSMSLRKIAELLGVKGKPQIAKYHLQQLEKAGLIQVNLEQNILKLVKKGYNHSSKSPLFAIPVVGAANCGPAVTYADQKVENYLKISSSLLPRNKNRLFAIKADGDSMNQADVNGKTIESGDYVLVDREVSNYNNGEIVLAIIDGLATIKEFYRDKLNNRIILKANSDHEYMPIYIGEDDQFIINGKVVDVIKN